VSSLTLIRRQVPYDLRVYSRDPRARWTTLAMPVLLMLLFGYIFRHQTFTESGITIPGNYYYLPRMIVLGLTGATLSNLVLSVVAKRATGALKRRRATPVRPVVLIAGDVITSEVSALAITVVLLLIAWIAFSVHPSASGIVAVFVIVIVGTVALCGVAYALSTFISTIDSAGPTVMGIVFVLNAISGIWVPETLFPVWLRDIAQYLPIRPLASAMQAAVDPRLNGGRLWEWPDLLIVAVWGVIGTVVAIRRFSWSP